MWIIELAAAVYIVLTVGPLVLKAVRRGWHWRRPSRRVALVVCWIVCGSSTVALSFRPTDAASMNAVSGILIAAFWTSLILALRQHGFVFGWRRPVTPAYLQPLAHME